MVWVYEETLQWFGFYFFSFVFLFFPKHIQRSAIAVYLQKLQGLVYTHHNNSYYFLGSHYLKQMVEESWSPAGCFPRGRQLLLVTAGQMSNSDSQDTYFIKKKKGEKSYLEETQLLRLSRKPKMLKLLSRIPKSPSEFYTPTRSLPRYIYFYIPMYILIQRKTLQEALKISHLWWKQKIWKQKEKLV